MGSKANNKERIVLKKWTTLGLVRKERNKAHTCGMKLRLRILQVLYVAT